MAFLIFIGHRSTAHKRDSELDRAGHYVNSWPKPFIKPINGLAIREVLGETATLNIK